LEGCTLFEESDTRIGYPEIVSAMAGVDVLSVTGPSIGAGLITMVTSLANVKQEIKKSNTNLFHYLRQEFGT
jgi:hypothetical protein